LIPSINDVRACQLLSGVKIDATVPRQKTIEAWSVLLMVVGVSGRKRAGQAGFGMRILLNVVGGLAILVGSFFGTLFILDHLPLDPVAREVNTLRTALQRYRLDRLSYPVLVDVPISDLTRQLVSSGHLWDSGRSSGAHQISIPMLVPASEHIAGTGDFDGNGRDDILWRDDSGGVFVWNNGQASGGHSLAAAGSVAASWHIAGTGDFDGNGKSDIFWQNDNGSAAIWDNGQPSGGYIVGSVPAGWHII
jgi:hypothetical protein